MRIAVVYNTKDNKLSEQSYSQAYRSQWLALLEYPDCIHITQDTDMDTVEADVVIFYDVHSSHHIKLDNIKHHKSIKYEYFNDPHQMAVSGFYPNGIYVRKLDAKERIERALERGVDYIICPFTEPYFKYFSSHLGGRAESMFVWFPPAPDLKLFPNRTERLKDRRAEVLGNGCTRETKHTTGYAFRKWAYQQPYISYVPHCEVGQDKNVKTPNGLKYGEFLAQYAASLALTDDHIVPKYLEIPLAGCVCFASEHQDYKNMGFQDSVNCIFVNKNNIESKVKDFLACPNDYQQIADSGRKLIESKWTSEHFAQFVINHAKENYAR
jgi:hypothetical protein